MKRTVLKKVVDDTYFRLVKKFPLTRIRNDDHLEEASHNKHGERVVAVHQINEAIEAARKHEHKRMEEHIAHAIKDIREGKEEIRK